MTGIAVELLGVDAGYGNETTIEAVSLKVRPGEICAVLGPNGAGKSTMVKLLSGLLRPRRGKVTVFGHDLSGLDRHAIARLVAVVPQHVEVALGFTVHEVAMMGRAPHQRAWMHPTSADQKAVSRALEACDLVGFDDRPVAELSGGEQTRVAIARALAQEGRLLVLDEAAAHLDIRHTIALYEVVRRELSRRESACITVLHDLNAAAQYADRVVLLKGGRLIAEGTVEQIMTYSRLKEVFEAELYVGVNELDGARYFLPVRPREKER